MQRQQLSSRLALAVVALCVVAVIAVVNLHRGRSSHVVSPTATVSSTPSPVSPLGCPSLNSPTVEAVVAMQAPPSRDLRAVVLRCSEPRETRNPSQLIVVDDDDDARIVAIPVRAARQWHFTDLTARGATLTLTGTVWSYPPNSADRGALFRQGFSISDDGAITAVPPVRLALACGPADLTVTLLAAGLEPSLRLRNRSAGRCVLEGYPTVTGVTAAGRRVPAAPVTPTTDWSESVVVLDRGDSATAILQTAATPASSQCASLTRLELSLPSGAALNPVATTMGVCSLRVQPFAAAR